MLCREDKLRIKVAKKNNRTIFLNQDTKSDRIVSQLIFYEMNKYIVHNK